MSTYTYSRPRHRGGDGRPDQRERSERPQGAPTPELNQLVTGDWLGTLSAFGATDTQNLDSVVVNGQTATVFEQGEWTASRAQRDGRRERSERRSEPKGRTATTRLVRAEQDPNVGGASARRLDYTYDYMGRRRTRQVYTWATDHWQLTTDYQFIWDGWLLLAERITPQSTGEMVTRTYVCGLDLSGQLGGEGVDAMSTAGGIGGILAVTYSAGSTVVYTYDGNGNVADLIDPVTSSTVASYEYSPFGKVLVATGPLADSNPIRFSTKYLESSTALGAPAGPDLYYYGYRYYTPATGRWANRDPIGERGGINLHVFPTGNPISVVDMLGLKSTCEVIYYLGHMGDVSAEETDYLANRGTWSFAIGNGCWASFDHGVGNGFVTTDATKIGASSGSENGGLNPEPWSEPESSADATRRRAVGFVRLVKRNWRAALSKAEELAANAAECNKNCPAGLSVRFVCLSGTNDGELQTLFDKNQEAPAGVREANRLLDLDFHKSGPRKAYPECGRVVKFKCCREKRKKKRKGRR